MTEGEAVERQDRRVPLEEELQLDTTLFLPSNPRARGIVLVHGFLSAKNGRCTDYAERMAEQGFPCMTLSLRGHGTSDGKTGTISQESMVADISGCVDHFQINTEVKETVLFGSSMGAAGVLAYAAALAQNNQQKRLYRLVLLQPFPSHEAYKIPQEQRDHLEQIYAEYEKTGKDVLIPHMNSGVATESWEQDAWPISTLPGIKTIDAIASAEQVSTPTYMIFSEDDEAIDSSEIRKVYRVIDEGLQIGILTLGGGHGMREEPKILTTMVCKILGAENRDYNKI